MLDGLLGELRLIAKRERCSFIRMSPFWPIPNNQLNQFSIFNYQFSIPQAQPSPLHLLAEHVWYLPLKTPDPWNTEPSAVSLQPSACTEESILMGMRKTTRNLIRRAEKEGVTVTASDDPVRDTETFIALHDETRRRHGFTPYTNAFFRAQVRRFAPREECSVYLARYQGQIIASSIHMHAFGETSYHHGASTHAFSKIPASYLLQWTAIRSALRRGDNIYNFWGIAPPSDQRSAISDQHESASNEKRKTRNEKHPFAGVTLFKTGFGGHLLELPHCMDIPLSWKYSLLTRPFEIMRKWRRGF
ncbi:MAG: peptidoglycan bridge formation glycyltransferase FemA/FemB family protein [Candidatus Peregrinibacteria bacterium]